MIRIPSSIQLMQKRSKNKFNRLRERHCATSVLREISKLPISIESVIDIGAYRGEFSRNVRKVFPNTRILLVEPNLEHNSYLRGETVVNEVLSNSVKEIDFFNRGETGDSYFPERNHLSNSTRKTRRTTKTLDLLLEEYTDFKSPHLIKLDTQGSELEILRGSSGALKSTKVVVCETPVVEYNLGAPTFDEYMNFFLESDFVPWRISEVHVRKDVLVQLDIVFLSRQVHVSCFGASRASQILW